jgi:hypothetical protein
MEELQGSAQRYPQDLASLRNAILRSAVLRGGLFFYAVLQKRSPTQGVGLRWYRHSTGGDKVAPIPLTIQTPLLVSCSQSPSAEARAAYYLRPYACSQRFNIVFQQEVEHGHCPDIRKVFCAPPDNQA